jgi:serine/threonine-protein kinase
LVVEALILKALAKDPAIRYQSMDELAAALLSIDPDGNLAAQPDPGPPCIAAALARPNTDANPVAVPRPQTGSRTGTVVLGPLPAAPRPDPTVFLARHDDGCTPAPTHFFDPLAGTRPGPACEPTTPPAPCTRPPTWNPQPHETISAPPRSRLGIVLAAALGALLALAAGAVTAWLLVVGRPDLLSPIAVAAPEVAAPAVLAEPASSGLYAFQLAPPPPRPVVAKPPPKPEPEPEPEALEPTSTRKRHHARPRNADHRSAVDIARGFVRARARVQECLSDDGQRRLRILATVGSAGDVLDVHVIGNVDPDLARCVTSAVRAKARFSRTTQSPQGRYWTYQITAPQG